MKNKNVMMTVAFIAMLFSVKTIKAQACAYNLNNMLLCSITYTITWTQQPSCTICNSVSGTLGANSSVAPTCGSCGTICDVFVSVNVAGTTYNLNSSSPPQTGASSIACSPSTGNVIVTWGSGGTTIQQ